MRAAVSLALALTLTPVAANAALFVPGSGSLSIEGPINPGDATRLMTWLDQAVQDGAPIRTVRLNSPGGLVDEGLAMARTIRAHGLDTAVETGGMCASACFMLFAAGNAKAVEPYGRVGVHSASQTYGMGPDDDAATFRMAALVQSFGVPDLVVGRMTIEANGGMAWLSVAELQAMGASVALATVDNTWSLPGARYDEAATKQFIQAHAGQSTAGADGLNRYKSGPLYRLITGK